MRGAMTLDGVVRPAWVEITIAVADVASFLADPAHPGVVTGSVHVDGLTAESGAQIGGGSFHLFLDEGDPAARAMRYELPFHDADGRHWTLRGVKDVRGRRLIDFWRSTTTLATQVVPTDADVPTASGQLRLGARDVARLIASMRAERGRRVAYWRFLRFYARTLLRLYVAGKRRRRA
jgi:cholesterol oxidase